MKTNKFLLLLVALTLLSGGLRLGGGERDWLPLLQKKALQYFPLAVEIRRDLHQIPETCFQEEQTARYVAQFLEKLPLEIHKEIAGHGLKAILRGTRPTPVIAIRAEMDALPIVEKTGLPFSSRHAGNAHACGHDVHMTNALICAKILTEMRGQLPGTVVFVFQPCEEGTGGEAESGAARMVAAGALDNPKVEAMLGLHVLPGIPAGAIALRPGAIMANMDTVNIKIIGKSSHGAFPHQGIDAIYVAAAAIMQFQSLISRQKDPKESAVLSIGMINGGVKSNVLAESVAMSGTVRSFSFATQKLIQEGMEKILKGLVLMYGIQYEFQFTHSSAFVKNDARLTAQLLPLFARVLGAGNVRETDPLTISEDYSIYSQRLPAIFFFLGSGRQEALHSASFDVDEAILKTGPALFAAAALELLNQGIHHD